MRRVCTLATLSALALGISAGRARAAHLTVPSARTARAAASAITALSVVPADGRADVIIALSGPVSVQDFTVEAPHRIVVDLSGARLTALDRSYDRKARGGIMNIRMSQYRPDIVRIVLDLDAPHTYVVSHSDAEVRVSVATSEKFAAWHSRDRGAAVAAAPAVPDVEPPAVGRGAVSDAGGEVIDSAVAPTTLAVPASAVAGDRVPTTTPVAQQALRDPVPLFAQQSQQQRMTVSWQDADIRDVIAGFAAQTGRTIVVGKSVTGTITAEIKDQPWDVALKAILESQGLAATEDSTGIITVDSYQNILERQASEPLTTQMVNINYVSAASLVPTIAGLLSKDCPQAPPPATGNQQPGQTLVPRSRQRRRRQWHQLADHHRSHLAPPGPDDVRQAARRAHAAGRAQGQAHLGEPHVRSSSSASATTSAAPRPTSIPCCRATSRVPKRPWMTAKVA